MLLALALYSRMQYTTVIRTSHATVWSVNKGKGADSVEMMLPPSTFTTIESDWLTARELKESELGKIMYLEGCEFRKRLHGKTMYLCEFMAKCDALNTYDFATNAVTNCNQSHHSSEKERNIPMTEATVQERMSDASSSI